MAFLDIVLPISQHLLEKTLEYLNVVVGGCFRVGVTLPKASYDPEEDSGRR